MLKEIMAKINTTIFCGCMVFLVVFFFFVYKSFLKEVALVNMVKLNQGIFNGSLESPVEQKIDLSEMIDESLTTEGYPPCHSYRSMRWVHDPETGECYEVGSVGPCGVSMTFYQDKNRLNYGFCDCDDVVEVKSSISECEGVERPLIFHPDFNRCYTVFSQGPCQEHQWLVLNESYYPVCEKNTCLTKQLKKKFEDYEEDDYSLDFWFKIDKKCYKTLTRGYCRKGSILKATKTNWMPECQVDMQNLCPPSISISIPRLDCRPGSKLQQMGLCTFGKV